MLRGIVRRKVECLTDLLPGRPGSKRGTDSLGLLTRTRGARGDSKKELPDRTTILRRRPLRLEPVRQLVLTFDCLAKRPRHIAHYTSTAKRSSRGGQTQPGTPSHLSQEPASRGHRMEDGLTRVQVSEPDLKQAPGRIAPHHDGHFTFGEGSDRVAVGVQDRLIGDSVAASAGEDSRIHLAIVTSGISKRPCLAARAGQGPSGRRTRWLRGS